MLFPELVEVLDPEPHGAALNMAIDEALLQEVERPTLRVYRWREPAVSFGYFGRISDAENAAGARTLVRRWTGGGIVEHGDDLTYTLLVPRGHGFLQHAPAESYRLVHAAIVELLVGEGRPAQTAPATAGEREDACFAKPVQFDVVDGKKKIAGAAQRRTRWGLLHQGSIQMPHPLPELAARLALAFGSAGRQQPLAARTIGAAQILAGAKYATAAWMQRY